MFKGDARYRALKLCGWGIDESELKIFLNRLEEKKQFARAAALAVFNLEIRLALQILEKVRDYREMMSARGLPKAQFLAVAEAEGANYNGMHGNQLQKMNNFFHF